MNRNHRSSADGHGNGNRNSCGSRNGNGHAARSERNGAAQAEPENRDRAHPEPHRAIHRTRTYWLVTGGAGFIGSNMADRLLRMGKRVLVFDNLSRPGVAKNLEWLKANHPHLLVDIADIRDRQAIARAVRGAERVCHYTAQVAVTTSLVEPLEDFEINARGTVQLLDALRRMSDPPPIVYTSTNKVYGALEDIALRSNGTRYEPIHRDLLHSGVGELRNLDFHSPYGCSKGTADQYVIDFARTMGVPGVVFRMSCIYGPRQFGTEDQGWVAHFLIKAMSGEPITIYGDGKQVRDILFIDDLVDAFLLAHKHMERLTGRAFNIGGGPKNTISLLELIDLVGEICGQRPEVRFETWRTADQRYYVSGIDRFQTATGWSPKVGVREGVTRLREWLEEFRFGRRAAEIHEAVTT